MDTTFIVDSSVCDDLGNWNRVLKFVQTLVTFFNVSPSGGRIALIPYSTNANVVLKFNTLTGSLLNGDEVNRRVGLLQCQGGSRRIDKALDLADKEVLTSAGGVRDISRVKQFSVNIHLVSYHRSRSDCSLGVQAFKRIAVLPNLSDPNQKLRSIFADS